MDFNRISPEDYVALFEPGDNPRSFYIQFTNTRIQVTNVPPCFAACLEATGIYYDNLADAQGRRSGRAKSIREEHAEFLVSQEMLKVKIEKGEAEGTGVELDSFALWEWD